MLKKRIIPCLDVQNRRVTKGVRFQNNVDVGSPVEMALEYSQSGCDELVFYDITASAEQRSIDIGMVREIAQVIHIPFAVGGGIASLDDMYAVLSAGAEKISVNSLAIENPALIAEGAKLFGSQCIVLGMDPVKSEDTVSFPSGYEITRRGFRERTGKDALQWAKQAEDAGVGEIVINSVDADGTRKGYDIVLTRQIALHVGVPVIASGGGGTPEHLFTVFQAGYADGAIIASMIHSGEYSIADIKHALDKKGIPIRKKW